MKKVILATVIGCVVFSMGVVAQPNTDKIVIAHRGASGYLPEHTLPAKALAYGMKPD